MINCQLQVIGRLGGDPYVRHFDDGNTVTNFNLAFNFTRKRDGVREDQTKWFQCSAWGRTGEVIAQHLKKGDIVMVSGMPEVRAYLKDGEPVAVQGLTVREFAFMPGGSNQDNSRERSPLPDTEPPIR